MVPTETKKSSSFLVSILFGLLAIILMMGSVNKIILVGILGKDPKICVMPDGSTIASFSVATSERWKDKSADKNATE